MRKWECTVCGHIHEGAEPPEECPICSADKSMFVEMIADNNTAEQGQEPVIPSARPSFLSFIYSKVSELILQYHLHPITVHTPNGIIPMAIMFWVMAVFLHLPLFELVAFYSLVYVLLVMPAVLLTGYEVWQKRYRGALTSIFKIKIGSVVVTVLTLLTLVIWRFVQPQIMAAPSKGRWIFLGLAFVLLGAVALAGHIGGKLVFGNRK
jgi:uncharacterized membrane protein